MKNTKNDIIFIATKKDTLFLSKLPPTIKKDFITYLKLKHAFEQLLRYEFKMI